MSACDKSQPAGRDAMPEASSFCLARDDAVTGFEENRGKIFAIWHIKVVWWARNGIYCMIGFLRGALVERHPTRLLLDVHGVGYEVLVPLSTYEKFAENGQTITLLTHLHVREDSMQLFGFATSEEKKLFQRLIAVSGIGPKVALGILSGCGAKDFYQFIRQREVTRLTALPGIGKKTAERLILELRDKLPEMDADMVLPAQSARASQIDEALLALVSLGYNRLQAEKVVRRVHANAPDADSEMLIKLALREM